MSREQKLVRIDKRVVELMDELKKVKDTVIGTTYSQIVENAILLYYTRCEAVLEVSEEDFESLMRLYRDIADVRKKYLG